MQREALRKMTLALASCRVCHNNDQVSGRVVTLCISPESRSRPYRDRTPEKGSFFSLSLPNGRGCQIVPCIPLQKHAQNVLCVSSTADTVTRGAQFTDGVASPVSPSSSYPTVSLAVCVAAAPTISFGFSVCLTAIFCLAFRDTGFVGRNGTASKSYRSKYIAWVYLTCCVLLYHFVFDRVHHCLAVFDRIAVVFDRVHHFVSFRYITLWRFLWVCSSVLIAAKPCQVPVHRAEPGTATTATTGIVILLSSRL